MDSSRTQNLRPECHCLLCNDGEPDSPQSYQTAVCPQLTWMQVTCIYDGLFCYLNSSGTSTSPVNSTGHAHFISSSSLPLQRCKFGLGFPHDRCPFYSVHTSCSPSFHAHIPQVQFNIFHSHQSTSSFFSLSSWFPFQ